MDEPTGLGVSFVVCFVVALVVMFFLSPYWYSFATSVLPQLANKVAVQDDKDDPEKGGGGGTGNSDDRRGNASERTLDSRAEREREREREKEKQRLKKPQKLEDVAVPNALESSGINYTAVYRKLSKEQLWPTLQLVSVNDQHVSLLQNVIISMSSLTAEYLNHKLLLFLCCAQISLRQLSRTSQNTILRDDEQLIIARLMKVTKRQNLSENAEIKELESNLPKVLANANSTDPKKVEEASARLARLNIQRRLNFVHLLINLQEHYRKELLDRITDEQVEFGMSVLLALLMEGEAILNKFIKQRLLAIVDRNSRRFTIQQNRSNGSDITKVAAGNQQALAEALDYVFKPRAQHAATVIANPASQQEQPQILNEQQQKDLVVQFESVLQKSVSEISASRKEAQLAKPVVLEDRLEREYLEILQQHLKEKEQLLTKADSVDPTEFSTVYKSVVETQEKELMKLWERADNMEFEEFKRATEERENEVLAKFKSAAQTLLESKFPKREDQREIMDAFIYSVEKFRNRDRNDRKARELDTLRKFSDARERMEEKALQLYLELSTVIFRRSVLEMVEVNLIISEEARAKTKTELDYSISCVWNHLILTKFELDQRVELKLKPLQIKLAAAKDAKRAELTAAMQSNEKDKPAVRQTELERVNANRKLEEDVNAALKAESDQLNVAEKRELLLTRDQLIEEADLFVHLFEKQLCVSVGRYLATQARFEDEETNADLTHDLLDSVLKRLVQNASEMGNQSERLLQSYQADVGDLQDRLGTQRDSKVDRIIDTLNRTRRQKEIEINEHTDRQLKLISRQPETYTARQFAKLVIEEKAERERDRIGKEVMRVELLRYKTGLDRKTAEDSKQALQDEKKLLLINLAKLCAASPSDVRRYAEAAAIDLIPADVERRKTLVDKLVTDFKYGMSKNDGRDY